LILKEYWLLILLRRILNKIVTVWFRRFEAFGIHVTPIVYDSPIPLTKDLTQTVFKQQSDCVGLDWNDSLQKYYLHEVFPAYATEIDFSETPNYSLVDSAILHSIIRHHKPKKVVEIGSGETTLISSRSGAQNTEEGAPYELLAIDPYSKKHLRTNFPSNVTLIEKRIEDMAIPDVSDCDLLFIDSSHVIKTGGDVNYELLEIVPRLKPGTIIHWHDILLPGEYWEDWVKDKHYFWTEQYLLHAFLKFNNAFEIIWASRYMHLKYPNEIKSVFPTFQPDQHRITSFWIIRK